MSEPSCYHLVGPIEVEHRPGYVAARCLSCDALVSGWFPDETETSEALELRGVAEDVKDHLDRCHREVDLAAAGVLRVCAWRTVGLERVAVGR